MVDKNDFIFFCDGHAHCGDCISASALFYNNHRNWTVTFIAGVGPLVRCARCSYLDMRGPMYNCRAQRSTITNS